MDNLLLFFSLPMLLSALRLSIPLGLAAVGTTVIEKSGVINLGVEGVMLLGAFSAVVGTYFTGNPWLGMLTACAIGAIIGAGYAVLVLKFKSNQSVSGIGFNIFAAGFTIVATRAIWRTEGMSVSVSRIDDIRVPFLADLPGVGKLFDKVSPYLLFTLLIVAAVWFFLYRTRQGLRLRAIGQNRMAAETAGIPVTRYTCIAIVVSCMLCSLGGSYLSIVHTDSFVKNMVAGRGYMAIAANIFGKNHPIGAYLASFVFAYAQAMRISLNVSIPDQFVQMLPYVITLIFLVIIAVNDKRAARRQFLNH